jgi:hypothetical protein
MCGAYPGKKGEKPNADLAKLREEFVRTLKDIRITLHRRCPSVVNADYFNTVNDLSSNAQSQDLHAVPHGLSSLIYQLSLRVDRKCNKVKLPHFVNDSLRFLTRKEYIILGEEGSNNDEGENNDDNKENNDNNDLNELSAALSANFSPTDAKDLLNEIRRCSTKDSKRRTNKHWRRSMCVTYIQWYFSKILDFVLEEMVGIQYHTKWKHNINEASFIDARSNLFANAPALKLALEKSVSVKNNEPKSITAPVFLNKEEILEHKYMSLIPCEGEEKRYNCRKEVKLEQGLTSTDIDVVQILMLSRVSKEAKAAVQTGFAACNPTIKQNSSSPESKSEARFLSGVMQTTLSNVFYYSNLFYRKYSFFSESGGEAKMKGIPNSLFKGLLSSRALCDSVKFFGTVGYDPNPTEYQKYQDLMAQIKDLTQLRLHFPEKGKHGDQEFLLDPNKMMKFCEENYKPVPNLISFFVQIHSIFMKNTYEKLSKEENSVLESHHGSDWKKNIIEVNLDNLWWFQVKENLNWGPIATLEHFNNILADLGDDIPSEFHRRYCRLLADSNRYRFKFADEHFIARRHIDDFLNALCPAIMDTDEQVIVEDIEKAMRKRRRNETVDLKTCATKWLRDVKNQIAGLGNLVNNEFEHEEHTGEDEEEEGDEDCNTNTSNVDIGKQYTNNVVIGEHNWEEGQISGEEECSVEDEIEDDDFLEEESSSRAEELNEEEDDDESIPTSFS